VRVVRSWFRDTTGGLPATFWYLWTGTLINRLGSFILVFLAIYLTTTRGFSALDAGLVIGLWGAGGAVGTMVGGILADRWGRRPTLLGMFAEAARPAFAAMMVDVVPERDRLRAFSLNYWAINLGFACSAILAGFAAQANYLLLFVVDAATTLITAAIIFLKVRESRGIRLSPAAATSGTPAVGGLRSVLRDRIFLGFVVLNLFSALIFLQHISMLPITMGQDGLGPATYGTVIALNGILIVAGQLFVPRLIRGRSRSHVLALATVITGVGFGLTAFADPAWFYAITVLIWTLGEMLTSPSNSTLVAELSPASSRGRYQGVFGISWSVAGFIAPITGGFVREQFGNSALWLGCAALAGLLAITQLVAGPARERRVTALRRSLRPEPRTTITPPPLLVAPGSPDPAEPGLTEVR
jgi:MFS family permease